MPAEPFEIQGEGITAVGSDSGVLVAFAGAGHARMFRRRAVRMHADGSSEPIEMLVASLDGVRTYLRRDACGRLDVVVSRLDLQP